MGSCLVSTVHNLCICNFHSYADLLLQLKTGGKEKELQFVFVKSEEAFDRVPSEIDMKKVVVEQCVGRVRVWGEIYEECSAQLEIHEGLVLSLQLFILSWYCNGHCFMWMTCY